jgi:hypothetical protein
MGSSLPVRSQPPRTAVFDAERRIANFPLLTLPLLTLGKGHAAFPADEEEIAPLEEFERDEGEGLRPLGQRRGAACAPSAKPCPRAHRQPARQQQGGDTTLVLCHHEAHNPLRSTLTACLCPHFALAGFGRPLAPKAGEL